MPPVNNHDTAIIWAILKTVQSLSEMWPNRRQKFHAKISRQNFTPIDKAPAQKSVTVRKKDK